MTTTVHRGGGPVRTHLCMSLDGFVAQRDDDPAELFDWYRLGDALPAHDLHRLRGGRGRDREGPRR